MKFGRLNPFLSPKLPPRNPPFRPGRLQPELAAASEEVKMDLKNGIGNLLEIVWKSCVENDLQMEDPFFKGKEHVLLADSFEKDACKTHVKKRVHHLQGQARRSQGGAIFWLIFCWSKGLFKSVQTISLLMSYDVMFLGGYVELSARVFRPVARPPLLQGSAKSPAAPEWRGGGF